MISTSQPTVDDLLEATSLLDKIEPPRTGWPLDPFIARLRFAVMGAWVSGSERVSKLPGHFFDAFHDIEARTLIAVRKWLVTLNASGTQVELAPKQQAVNRKAGRRVAASYRGARRNAWHASRRSNVHLRDARRSLGLSRKQYDRLRAQVNNMQVRGAV